MPDQFEKPTVLGSEFGADFIRANAAEHGISQEAPERMEETGFVHERRNSLRGQDRPIERQCGMPAEFDGPPRSVPGRDCRLGVRRIDE